MNALTAVQNNAVDSGQDYSGFTLIPSAQSPRLLELTFTEQTTKQFLEQVAEWPVQALEYKSFLRFRVGKILDDLCANQLQPVLLKTLLNRDEGALLINAVGVDEWRQAADWDQVQLTGDGLVRYGKLLGEDEIARCVERDLWWPSGEGLLLAHAAGDGDPARVLPIYKIGRAHV